MVKDDAGKSLVLRKDALFAFLLLFFVSIETYVESCLLVDVLHDRNLKLDFFGHIFKVCLHRIYRHLEQVCSHLVDMLKLRVWLMSKFVKEGAAIGEYIRCKLNLLLICELAHLEAFVSDAIVHDKPIEPGECLYD